MSSDALKIALLELIRAATGAGIRMFLGGGYGLYLKQLHLMSTRQRTFLPVEAWPRPRATPDLDIFLPTEIVIDLAHMTRLRAILDELGYGAIEGAKFMHFRKEASQGHVQVELLTGPIGLEQRSRVQIKGPRVRPRGKVELHAYLTPEAVAFDVQPLEISLDDVVVAIPNAFSFLVMKLHACHDRIDDENKQLGRHHALDVYRILAMLSEPEEQLARALRSSHRDSPGIQRAAQIAGEMFASLTSRGVLRMREHNLATDDMRIEPALELLGALLDLTG